MPTWVNYSTAQAFHAIRKAYAYSTTAFKTAVLNDYRGAKSWTRQEAGTIASYGDNLIEINVEAVPGVVPLRRDGHPFGHDGAPDL